MLKSFERFPKNLLFEQKRQPDYGSIGGVFGFFSRRKQHLNIMCGISIDVL
jgi:hypothetical protein